MTASAPVQIPASEAETADFHFLTSALPAFSTAGDSRHEAPSLSCELHTAVTPTKVDSSLNLLRNSALVTDSLQSL